MNLAISTNSIWLVRCLDPTDQHHQASQPCITPAFTLHAESHRAPQAEVIPPTKGLLRDDFTAAKVLQQFPSAVHALHLLIIVLDIILLFAFPCASPRYTIHLQNRSLTIRRFALPIEQVPRTRNSLSAAPRFEIASSQLLLPDPTAYYSALLLPDSRAYRTPAGYEVFNAIRDLQGAVGAKHKRAATVPD